MQRRFIISVITASVFLAPLVIRASAGDKEGTEKELTLADVPAAAQAAIKQFAGSNAITKIKQESEDGKTVYEAKVKINGVKQEVEVLADGTVLQTEKQVSLTDTPGVVQTAIKQLAGAGTVDEIVEETAAGKKTYEVAVTINGKKKEADITADGKISDNEEKDEQKGHGDGNKD